VAIAAMGLGLATVIPTVAGAAFPGTNGVIAFVTTRNNAVAISQVDPRKADGTSSGDLAATTPLTNGSTDAEPFYSPDGTTLAFSSNRSLHWAIYTIAQSDQGERTPAVAISQAPGGATHDDYGPSFTDDGQSIVFNRDNAGIYSVYVPAGPSSVCDLYNPAGGIANAASDNGASSRVVFDPVDPTKLVYVSGTSNHIHLLSGVTVPTAAHPCPSQSGLTDTDLSATAAGTPLTATQADANPDWSPDGTKIIFDSTRSCGKSLWYFTNPTSGSPTVTALWPGLASGSTTDTQPVYSPDGQMISYTQPVLGSGNQIVGYDYQLVGVSAPQASQLTLGAGASSNSQSDWQPLQPGPNLPEAPSVLMLPGVALLAGGGFVLLRTRRRTNAA